MNRAGWLLLVLLLVQLAIYGSVYRADRQAADNPVITRLVDAGPYIIDALAVDDGKGGEVNLALVGDQWSLPGLGGLPADGERVQRLIDRLTVTDPGWTVANTLAARQRFQVADYLYQRRIALSAQERVIASVFLGSSPGFRKVHARNAERDTIHSIDLNVFEVPASAGDWVDRSLLQVRAPLRIVADGYTLLRDSGQWRIDNGAEPDQRELQALLRSLRNLQVEGVATPALRRELDRAEAALELRIEDLGGPVTLRFYAHAGRHLVLSSRYPYGFVISAYTFEQISGIDRFLLSGANGD